MPLLRVLSLTRIAEADGIDYMSGMLAAFPGMTVTPLDCAGKRASPG